MWHKLASAKVSHRVYSHSVAFLWCVGVAQRHPWTLRKKLVLHSKHLVFHHANSVTQLFVFFCECIWYIALATSTSLVWATEPSRSRPAGLFGFVGGSFNMLFQGSQASRQLQYSNDTPVRQQGRPASVSCKAILVLSLSYSRLLPIKHKNYGLSSRTATTYPYSQSLGVQCWLVSSLTIPIHSRTVA